MTAPLARPLPYAADELAEMRGWVSDCVWGDLDPDVVAGLTDRQIINGVRRHYSGGVSQFLADFHVQGPESYYQ
jgi:hypothetical protein